MSPTLMVNSIAELVFILPKNRLVGINSILSEGDTACTVSHYDEYSRIYIWHNITRD